MQVEPLACAPMAQGIPRVVWTLWLQGWDSAPPLVQACLTSWESRNPTWTVRALTSETLGDYLDLAAIYPMVDLSAVPAASLSDMVRVALLAEHGGVWVDSTVFCVRPLDGWLDDYTGSGFFAFARPGPDRMVSSWFLASEPNHPITLELRDRVRAYWRDRSAPDHYFWLHRLFFEAYRTHAPFRQLWDATPEFRSDGPHYFVPYRGRLAGRMTRRARARVRSGTDPVYKLSHRREHSSPDPRSSYDFFRRWAAASPDADDALRVSNEAAFLVLDSGVERVRWPIRHAAAGMRAALVDRLRAGGFIRPVGPAGESRLRLFRNRSREN